jgi:serine/threonine protein phosphatase PrpC
MHLRVKGHSDNGLNKLYNEDTYLIDKSFSLFILCNGVGDQTKSAQISKKTAHFFLKHVKEKKKVFVTFNEDPSLINREAVKHCLDEIIQTLNESLWKANQNDPSKKTFGSTLLFSFFIGQDLFFGNIGNGCFFLLRNLEAFQLNEEHSRFKDLIKKNKIPVEERDNHPSLFEPTFFLGAHRFVEPDLFHMEAIDQDFFLMAADGLSAYLNPEFLSDTFEKEISFEKMPQYFIKKAHQEGAKDNITFVAIQTGKPGTPKKKKSSADQETNLPTQKIMALRKLPLFFNFNYRELLNILEIIDLKKFSTGDIILHEGVLGSEMFVILQGQVEVSQAGKKLTTLEKGQWFGEMALIDDEPRSATIKALSPSAFIILERTSLFKLLERHSQMGMKIFLSMLKNLNQRLRTR